MQKITGIKSVDIKVEASGRGVVNWNGSVNGEFGESHSMPKMRGVSFYKQALTKENKPFGAKNNIKDMDLSKAQIYVSQNAIRNALFKEEVPYHLELKAEDGAKLVSTLVGLLRGFAIVTGSQLMRKSPVMVTDFLAVESELVDLEFKSKSGSRDEKANIFTQTTQGKAKYEGLVSISIEELQFISLDNTYGRAATLSVNEESGNALAQKVVETIQMYDTKGRDVKVSFGAYKRINSVSKGAELGLLLNEGSMDVLVDVMVDKLADLQIMKSKGSLVSQKVTVKYNDKNFSEEIEANNKTTHYAQYYREALPEEIGEKQTAKDVQDSNKQEKIEAKTKRGAAKGKGKS